MDEYERLEAQLQQLYVSYAEKLRNLSYLEHRAQKFRRKEQEKYQVLENKAYFINCIYTILYIPYISLVIFWRLRMNVGKRARIAPVTKDDARS
jgi:hypothetical protein